MLALFRSGTPTKKSGDRMLRVTSGRFRPEIDGLRFFAIIPVLFSHLFERVIRKQNELGFLGDIESSDYHYFINHLPGVLLFFAISGYILTYQISNASKGGYDWLKYKKYIVKRFKRIAPPYYIVLVATFLVVVALHYHPSDAKRFEESQISLLPSLVASIFYSHWFVFGEWPRLFGAGWTLEIETQYYVIAPALTLVYLNLSRKTTRIATGVAVIFVSSVIASQYEVGNFWAGTIMKFFPYFFTGMLALELQKDLQWMERAIPKLLTDVVIVAVVFVYFSLRPPESGAGVAMFCYYVIHIACVMAMFIAVSLEGNLLRRICVKRYVVIIGGACYSIYLTHTQVFFLMTKFLYRRVVFQDTYLSMIFCAVLEVPVALLVGLTFYRLIERPFMMWRATPNAAVGSAEAPQSGARV